MSKGKGRYGNVKKPEFDGIRFDSHREMERYCDLKLAERAGVIQDLKVHPAYPIVIGDVEIRLFSKRYWKTGRHLTYEADFTYWDCERKCQIIEDVKMQSGHRTEGYRIKQALMTAMGHTIMEY